MNRMGSRPQIKRRKTMKKKDKNRKKKEVRKIRRKLEPKIRKHRQQL